MDPTPREVTQPASSSRLGASVRFLKVQREGELKPEGWSIGWGRHPQPVGFAMGVFGGSLDIPHEGFREWFFRLPVVGVVVHLTHYDPSRKR